MIRESLLAFTLLTGANGMDAISTQHVVRAGGVEAVSPWLYGERAQRVVPMKLVVSTAQTAVFVELRRRGHRKAAWSWVAGIVVTNILVARHNERLAAKLRATR